MSDIKLDIDRKMSYRQWRGYSRNCRKLIRKIGVTVTRVSVKGTRKGYHIIITISQSKPSLHICLFQSILGSDSHREANNYNRIVHGTNSVKFNWNLLFREKLSFDFDGKLKAVSKEESKPRYEEVLKRMLVEPSRKSPSRSKGQIRCLK